MSGKKCSNVTISSSQYDRLRSDARRADRQADNARRRTEEEKRRNKQLRDNFRREQAKMQSQFQAGLRAVSKEIRDVEATQNQRLSSLRSEVFDSLDDHRRQVESALTEHRNDVDQALRNISDEIAADKSESRNIAESRISDVTHLLSLMAADPATERFAPGAIEGLQHRLQDAKGMLGAGQYQAAFAQAQERYYDYQELRARVALLEGEWRYQLDLALAQSEAVAGSVSAAEKAEFSFEQTGSEQIDAEVDFWTEGALEALKERYKERAEALRSPEDFTKEQLESIENEFAEMDAQVEFLTNSARDSLIASQVRQNIGQSVLDTFDGSGWELDDNAYAGEDLRRGFHLKLKNSADEEIVVSIEPVETSDGSLSAQVEVNFFDRGNDEILRGARLAEISNSLRKEGVNVGDFACLDNSEGRPGDDRRRDFEHLRQQATVDRAFR